MRVVYQYIFLCMYVCLDIILFCLQILLQLKVKHGVIFICSVTMLMIFTSLLKYAKWQIKKKMKKKLYFDQDHFLVIATKYLQVTYLFILMLGYTLFTCNIGTTKGKGDCMLKILNKAKERDWDGKQISLKIKCEKGEHTHFFLF